MKNLFFLVTFIFAVTILRAQNTHVEFGLKGGLNIANLYYVPNLAISPVPPDFDPRISFHIGGLAHIHFTKHFAVQPELLFSGQGAKQTFAGTVYHTNLNYINIPVLLQYMIGTGVRLETGPQLGLLLSAQSKTSSTENNIKPTFRGYDVSWAFGVGYVDPKGYGVDLRYNFGMNDISTESPSTAPSIFKNRVIQLGIFKQFEKKEKKS